jgi:hypothetical protein
VICGVIVKITIWSDGFTSEIKGYVHDVNPISHELRMKAQTGEFHRIAFEDVVGVALYK